MQQTALGQLIPSTCPSEQQWGNFLQGAIAQLTLDSMSEHLKACSQCSKVVDQLATPSTTVQKVVKSPYLQEFNYLRMVARLEEVQVVSDAGDTVVEGKPRDTREVDVPVPDTIGRFVVRGVLGTGGFGRVYLADDPLLNRSVAIKAPRSSELGSDGDISSFLSEARHAAALDHPGIVPIFDVLADDSGRTLIVMKYIDGKPLKSLLHKGSLELPETIRILIQVARAVHFAHERGFVHRDLKPSNILIDRKGVPHVCDLGLGLNLSQQDIDLRRAGTPQYMSPEQVRHDIRNKIDRRSDIWSLGVMLAELVHGRRPFPQTEQPELFHAIEFEEPLIESNSETKSLDLIIRRCLAKSPADRYASADLLAEDLSAWLRRHYPTGLQRWQYGWRRNLLAAAVCLVALGSFAIGRNQLRQRELRFTVRQLESAPPQQVSKLVDELKLIHATPNSIAGLGGSSVGIGQFRLDIASISLGDHSSATVERCVDALQTAEPEEIRALVDVLAESDAAEDLANEIAGRLNTSKFEPRFEPSHFRLAAAFANLAYQHSLWSDITHAVAVNLVSLSDDDQTRWFPLFDQLGALQLAVSLQGLMSDPKADAEHQRNAARALARYLVNDAPELAAVIGEADSLEISELTKGLKTNREASIRCLESLISEQVSLPPTVRESDWDPPTNRDLRASRFAIALWLLGSKESAYEALQHAADPTLQTLLIHGLAAQDLEPTEIVQQLGVLEGADIRCAAIRFGLLQVLAELPIDVAGNREFIASLSELLNDLYLNPDSGVHAMARLVASRYGVELQRLQAGLHGQWLVDSIGQGVQDFSIIEPCVIEVGIHNGQRPPAGTASWPSHKRRFDRRIAIATNEVTIEQFRVFNSKYINDFIAKGDVMLIESVPQAAMMQVTPEAAHRFCNAWSDAAGLECCYEPKADEQGETKLVPKENYFLLNGYRLPTDGEWELACRAGTETSRYFGSSTEPLFRYAWTWEIKASFELASNLTVLSQRVGQLIPNRWGMFDMYGNASELCELGSDPPKGVQERSTEVVNDTLATEVPPGPGWPLIRGVSLTQSGMSYAHSHCRTNSIGGTYNRDFGFRVVRTLSDDETHGSKP